MKASATVSRPSRRPGLSRPAIFLGCVLLVVVCLFPFVWMGLSSIKLLHELYTIPPQWWPAEPTLASYQKLLDPQNSVGADFIRFFWNSLFVSTMTTVLAVAVAVPAAARGCCASTTWTTASAARWWRSATCWNCTARRSA